MYGFVALGVAFVLRSGSLVAVLSSLLSRHFAAVQDGYKVKASGSNARS
jgi:hypothetical protein